MLKLNLMARPSRSLVGLGEGGFTSRPSRGGVGIWKPWPRAIAGKTFVPVKGRKSTPWLEYEGAIVGSFAALPLVSVAPSKWNTVAWDAPPTAASQSG